MIEVCSLNAFGREDELMSTCSSGSITLDCSDDTTQFYAEQTSDFYELDSSEAALSVDDLNQNKVKWELLEVTLQKVPGLGYGVAISGGQDNPHFASGETSIAVSDVLRAGPAANRLKVNDRIVSVNGISLQGADHYEAIELLKINDIIDLVIKRRINLNQNVDESHSMEAVLDRVSKRQDFGLVLGCDIYVKDILSGSPAETSDQLKLGDTILSINDVNLELSALKGAQKQINKSKDKLKLTFSKSQKSNRHSFQKSVGCPSCIQYINKSSCGGSLDRDDKVRFVCYRKNGNSTGLRIAGGNVTGLFVSAVLRHSYAEREGVKVGDQIIKVNGNLVQGMTREQLVLMLRAVPDSMSLLLKENQTEYDNQLRGCSTDSGDSFYIRTHGCYKPRREANHMSFRTGDIFHVVNTVHQGIIGEWSVVKLGTSNQELARGVLPSQTEIEKLTQCNSGNHGNSVFTIESNSFSGHEMRKSPYEHVILQKPDYLRPVVIFSGLSDISRQYLASSQPQLFEILGTKRQNGKAEKDSVKITDIQNTIAKGKHCFLDPSPKLVSMLTQAQLYPIVIDLRLPDARILKDLHPSGSKHSITYWQKIFNEDQAVKLDFPEMFTCTLDIKTGDNWLLKLKDTIAREQVQSIWVSTTLPVSRESSLKPKSNSMECDSCSSSMSSLSSGPIRSQSVLLPRYLQSNQNNPPPESGHRLPRSTTDNAVFQRTRNHLSDGSGQLSGPAIEMDTLNKRNHLPSASYQNQAFSFNERASGLRSDMSVRSLEMPTRQRGRKQHNTYKMTKLPNEVTSRLSRDGSSQHNSTTSMAFSDASYDEDSHSSSSDSHGGYILPDNKLSINKLNKQFSHMDFEKRAGRAS